MAIHKIKTGNMTLWTGDGGLEMLNKAFKEEVERTIKELERKEAMKKELKALYCDEQVEDKWRLDPIQQENMAKYKAMTPEEIKSIILEVFEESGPFDALIESYNLDVREYPKTPNECFDKPKLDEEE